MLCGSKEPSHLNVGKITGVEWFGSETTKVWRQKVLSMKIEAKQPGRNVGGGGGGEFTK